MNTDLNIIKVYREDGSLTDEGKEYFKIGCNALSFNKFGVVILGGGQGTRLGTNDPKGLYKIAGKTLFEHHICKIKENIKKYKSDIKLYIMTSEYTHDKTKKYFEDNNNFGLEVDLFKQGSSICTNEKGESLKYFNKTVTAPNGNGDIFKAIRSVDINDLYAINVISVDNVLAQILDPTFVGAFIKNKLDILSKSVTKLENENVGIFYKNEGRLEIKEYSEIKEDISEKEANICNHLFKTDFIKYMGDIELPIHKAHKKIPYTENGEIINPTKPNGYKNEHFIFDCFQYTLKNGIMNVKRPLEFAPLKNSLECPVDNPRTCQEALEYYINLKAE